MASLQRSFDLCLWVCENKFACSGFISFICNGRALAGVHPLVDRWISADTEVKDFMPHYLIQASYTSEAWRALVNKPEDRSEAVRPVIEKLGGRIVNSWYTFGQHDVVAIVEMPDNVSVAALSLAERTGGALRSLETTALLEFSEGVEAMKRASKAGYRPPGK